MSHPASKRLISTAVLSQQEIRELKRQDQADLKQDLEHHIIVTRLNYQLARLKESTEFDVEKRAMARLEKSWSEHDAHTMGVEKIVARVEAANAIEYSKDPDRLKKRNETLYRWARDQIG